MGSGCSGSRDMIKSSTSLPLEVDIDDFQQRKQIGKGLTSRVVLVKHIDTKQRYALKIIPRDFVNTETRAKRVFNEKECLLALQHPHICKLVRSFKDSRNLYFLLEYIPGAPLHKHFRHLGHFSFPTALFYFAEIALTLDYVHQQGIIYRDIKASNILIAPDGHSKLIDFGFSRRMARTERSSSFVGTSFFMAPELKKHRPYSYTVDWWAMGVLLVEMLLGNSFDSKKLEEIADCGSQQQAEALVEKLVLHILQVHSSGKPAGPAKQPPRLHHVYSYVPSPSTSFIQTTPTNFSTPRSNLPPSFSFSDSTLQPSFSFSDSPKDLPSTASSSPIAPDHSPSSSTVPDSAPASVTSSPAPAPVPAPAPAPTPTPVPASVPDPDPATPTLADFSSASIPGLLSPDALLSVLNAFFNLNEEERLGAQGLEQVKSHPFFSAVKWQQIADRSAPVPYVDHSVAQYVLDCEDDDSDSDDEDHPHIPGF